MTKGRSDGRKSPPPKPAPHDPGRNMHPNAGVKHVEAPKCDPTRPSRPESKN